jgi:N6-adenosine-specific RNA methylase IME4
VRLITGGPFAGCAANHARVIYLDPPWKFRTFTADPGDRAPPYPTMTMDEIAALPIVDLAARDCWMFCWTSGPYLWETLKIIEGWGFTYSSLAFTWVKLLRVGEGFHRGLGKTTRKNTEQVLLARLGSPPILRTPDELLVTEEPDFGDVYVGRLREHSRKPDEIRSRIEVMTSGPRLELFARQKTPGWRVWGNQTGKFQPIQGTPE